MADLGLFIGHFHPLAVHLPIGIFLLLAVLELSTALAKRPALARLPSLTDAQRSLILACGAIAAAATALMGWLLAGGGGYDAALIHRHRWLGVDVAVLAALLLAVHLLRWPRIRGLVLVATLAVLVAAGHSGGGITHGSDFLTKNLPAPLRRLFGVASGAKRRPPPDPKRALAFADVVQPILEERCVSCHGPAKSNGDLRLDTWAALSKGGKHGPILKPGDSTASRLIQRVNLPYDEKGHMPPKGKAQLTDDEVTILAWWIDGGASDRRTLAELEQPPDVAAILSSRYGPPRPVVPPPDRTATFAVAAALVRGLGVAIHPLSPDGPWLSVSARLLRSRFGDAEFARLAAIAPAIQRLDLGRTAVTDAGLAPLAAMTNLRHLDLDGTRITDAGLARLAGLDQLAYLNLYGTAVTDAGLPSLRSLWRLRSLYLWDTRVTPAAAGALAARLTDRRKVQRLNDRIATLEDEVRSETFYYNLGASDAPAPAKGSK